jgi:exportin-7
MGLARCEGELAWLVYTIGAILGSHVTPSSAPETQQLIDGELSGRVFQLAMLTDSHASCAERMGARTNQQLELAVLFFFGQFRKVYIGDQATSSSKVYGYLAERLLLPDHLAVLTLLMQKILGHLKFRHECAELTSKALALFSELAAGYSSGKLLLKLDIVHQILRSHTAQEFPFLELPANGRHRTAFQGMLARLLFSESEQYAQFAQFMQPVQAALDKLCEAAQQGEVFGSDASKALLIGARATRERPRSRRVARPRLCARPLTRRMPSPVRLLCRLRSPDRARPPAQARCATCAASAPRARTVGRTRSSSTSSTRPTRRCCARWPCAGTRRRR